MKNEQAPVRWHTWISCCIVAGLAARLGLWCAGRDPGIYGTIAAIVGAFSTVLGFNLARGGVWGRTGLGVAGYTAAGHARGGSVVEAIVVGAFCGISIGLALRLIDRFRPKPEATDPEPSSPWTADRAQATTSALGPWDGE